MTSKEKLISDTVYNGLDVLFIALIGYLFWSLMGKMLSLYDYGMITVIITFYGFISTILTLNIQEVFGKMIPQFKARREENKIYGLIKYSAKIITFFSFIIFIIIFFLFHFNIFGKFYSQILLWVLILCIFGIIYIFLRGILYGYTFFKKIFFIDFFVHGIKIFMAFLFVYFGYNLGGVYAWIITFAIASFLFLKYILKHIKYNFEEFNFENKKQFIDNSKSSLIASLSSFLITGIGTIILSYYNIELTGLWGATIIIGQILYLFPSIIQSSVLPSISFFVKENITKVEIVFNSILKYLIIILLPGFILFSIFSKEIILLIYKQEFLYITNILPIYLIGIIFLALGYNILSVIFSSDNQKERNKILILSSIISLILNIILIYYLSLLGAALAFFLTTFILFILSLISIKKINIKLLFNYNQIINFLLLLFLFVPIIYLFSFIDQLLFIFIFIGIFLIFYFIILYKIKILNELDISIIQIIIKKLKEKIKL